MFANVLMDRRQSEVINAMRFPLIILVLFIHVIGFQVKPVELSWNGRNFYVFMTELVSHNLGAMAVPCFFLFSGYFFFKKMKSWNLSFYLNQLKNRFKTLLLPYIIWNILIILIMFAKSYVFSRIGIGESEEIQVLKLSNWHHLLWGMPINYPLWYLRDLICMSVLTPLFYYYFRFLKTVGVAILFVSYFSLWESNVAGLSSTAFMFFGLGVYFSLSHQNLLKITMRVEWPSYAFAFILLVVSTLFSETVYYHYCLRGFIVFGIISGLNLINKMICYEKIKRLLIKLSPTVFFIYAVHEIYIINWLKGFFMNSALTRSAWAMILGYFLIPFICLAVCLGVYKLLRLACPQLLSICVGSRTTN